MNNNPDQPPENSQVENKHNNEKSSHSSWIGAVIELLKLLKQQPQWFVGILLLLTLLIMGGAAFLHFGKEPILALINRVEQKIDTGNNSQSPKVTSQSPTPASQNIQDDNQDLSALKVSKPSPATLKIDGSVSMVRMIRAMNSSFKNKTDQSVIYGEQNKTPCGSECGLQKLIAGEIDIAAISRPLTSQEEKYENLVSFPIAEDEIAVVVGINNQVERLTLGELRDIYSCSKTNWKDFGTRSQNLPLRVINRSRYSGTRGSFQELVLSNGTDFCQGNTNVERRDDGSSFETLDKDQDQGGFQKLGDDGIYYTTVAHTRSQQTIRIVPVQSLLPGQDGYPLHRTLYLVVPKETSQSVVDFIEFARSSDGLNFSCQFHSCRKSAR